MIRRYTFYTKHSFVCENPTLNTVLRKTSIQATDLSKVAFEHRRPDYIIRLYLDGMFEVTLAIPFYQITYRSGDLYAGLDTYTQHHNKVYSVINSIPILMESCALNAQNQPVMGYSYFDDASCRAFDCSFFELDEDEQDLWREVLSNLHPERDEHSEISNWNIMSKNTFQEFTKLFDQVYNSPGKWFYIFSYISRTLMDFQRFNFESSLILGWVVIENLSKKLYTDTGRHLRDKNNKWINIYMILETLKKDNIIDQDEWRLLDNLRNIRNDYIHSFSFVTVSSSQAIDMFFLIERLIKKSHQIDISFNKSLSVTQPFLHSRL